MRIAFFSDNFYPELSGIADSIITTGRELAKRGHEIRFYAPNYSEANYRRLGRKTTDPFLIEHLSVERFFSLPYPVGTGQGRVVIPIFLRSLTIRKFRPDVLHVHLPFGVGLEGWAAHKLLGRPLVGTNHTPLSEFVRYGPGGNQLTRLAIRYNTWFYNQCDFVSSPAQAILEEMRQSGFKQPSSKISNPIHLNIFRPLTERRRLKKKYGLAGITLLYAGRLATEKNVDLILRAVAANQKRLPSLRLAIIGSGQAEADLKTLARTLRIEDKTIFFGFVPQEEEMNEIYNASDLFVIMSTAETQAIAAMQAMACGLPVIAARAWGLAEYVSSERGALIEPNDVKALAEEILKLAGNYRRRQRLGQAGKKFVTDFSPQAIADRWENIYKEIAAD